MNKFLLIIIVTLMLHGCKSNFIKFQDKAIELVSDDQKIDQQEFETLISLMKDSDEKGFKQFLNSQNVIDESKLKDYLLKLFIAKKITISESDIWQSEISKSSPSKFNINVFLENSGSMDGYVKGVTEFETAIYNLLGDIKINGICDSLNLNYINQIIPYSKPNALSPDIQDFIEKLEPSTFIQRGGGRGASDIKNILSHVLNTVNETNAAILISDFVFSPGDKDATEYLNNQSVGIKIDFAEKINHFDLSAIIIQLQSSFDGLYYDKRNTPIPIKCKRPYYIWILGSNSQIETILNKKIIDNIKGGFMNRLIFQSLSRTRSHDYSTMCPDYKILLNNKIGSFRLKNGAKGPISEAKKATDTRNSGFFGFNVAIDFSQYHLDEKYFTDTLNYKIPSNYNLSVSVNSDVSDKTISSYKHIISLKTDKLKDETIKIELIENVPSWVVSSTSNDDSNILNDDKEKNKTFGYKYLIDGVFDGFYSNSNSKTIAYLEINIKPAGQSLSFLVIILVLALISGLIIFIIKKTNQNE